LIAAQLGGPAASSREPQSFVWTDAESELIVHPQATRVRYAPGFVFVELGVECDQTGPARLLFPFKVGGSPNEAVLVAITEGQPRGDAVLAARWAEPATTLVWHAVLRAGLALLKQRRSKTPLTISGVYTLGQVLSFIATEPVDVADLRRYYEELGTLHQPGDLSVLNRRFLGSLPLQRKARLR